MTIGPDRGRQKTDGGVASLSRRALLVSGAAAPLFQAAGPSSARAEEADDLDPCRWVDPFIGTGGHGHTFPGATTPFGMVQLSPDTDNARWDACSGYHRDDPTLLGFSHTHLSGTGIGDMLDVLLRPAMGPVRLSPGLLTDSAGSYRARFRHEDERATPGYYRVLLPDEGIEVELTATRRIGLHRYVFHQDGPAHLLLDFEHGMRDRPGIPTRIGSAHLEVLPDGTILGGRQVDQWARGRHVFFALRLSEPATETVLYKNDEALPGTTATGSSLKCVMHLGGGRGRKPLMVKVGLSFVDAQGALRNLEGEAPGWDFDAAREAAATSWRERLSAIRIKTGRPDARTTFYTALYHTMIAPTLFNDRDGRYRGMNGTIRQLADGQEQYTTYSLWDTFRAEHPLLTLIEKERLPNILMSLVRMCEDSSEGLPVWPLMGIETGCMIAHHSLPVLAEASVKKIEGFEPATAWPAVQRSLLRSTDHGLQSYRSQGWIACDQVDESVSRTQEYAYDDWAASKLAHALGHHDEAAHLRLRSGNYRNLFDPKTSFMRPRLANGAWATPFAPNALGHSARWRDYTECNAWQATFMAQHDPYGLIRLFGGDAAFVRKLDAMFDADPALPPDAPPDIAGLVGQYAHGNEPSHHIAYLYAYAGAPHVTQRRTRMLMDTFYGPGDADMAGNEDCGQMSAWYVLSALGLYPVDPVSGIYVFGSPINDRADVRLRNGAMLTILAANAGSGSPYIQSVTWRGAAYTRSWIAHETLMAGGTLAFTMGKAPNRAFGHDPKDRPPAQV